MYTKMGDSNLFDKNWQKNGLFVDGAYVGPVIVIVGPTASGKTGVAVEIARELGGFLGRSEYDTRDEICGEIISADSRTIYKGMDIVTAKPDMAERQGVTHHGLDLVEPGTRFTVADWKEYTEQKICSIRKRGHVPIVVGGTGLYVDALVFNYRFVGKTGERATSIEQKKCSDRQEMSDEYCIFGIQWDVEKLRERIELRIKNMFRRELFEETERLVTKYGWDNQAMKSDIYQFAWKYMQGELSLEEAKKLAFYDDWHLAKRQLTWFKRNKNIRWVELQDLRMEIIRVLGLVD